MDCYVTKSNLDIYSKQLCIYHCDICISSYFDIDYVWNYSTIIDTRDNGVSHSFMLDLIFMSPSTFPILISSKLPPFWQQVLQDKSIDSHETKYDFV